jgi:putative hydrolase of the HAD superfamily
VAISIDVVRRASDERARANAEVFQHIDPDIIGLTRDLQSRGVRLATISNCMEEDARPWSGSALAPQFSCAIFSFTATCVKPDARIYFMAIDQMGVSPADTLYIGDGGDDELAGAACAGLRAAQAAWYVARAMPGTVPVCATPRDVLDRVFQ